MTHRSKFAVFMISALITIGALYYTLGRPGYIGHFRHHHCHQSESVSSGLDEK